MSPILPASCRPGDAGFVATRARAPAAPSARALEVLPESGFKAARAAITAWPGYAPTPLRELPGLAAAIGIAGLSYKDEAGRFGLGSFKALGGAYAVARQVELQGRGITIASATDGNHGRAVAWGAQRAGCRCVIYIHAHVSAGRADAIAAYGAEIRRIEGTYDDAVRACAADAAAAGWIVVSDTSWPGYEAIPREVMQGYQLMAEEAIAQVAANRPTHIFVQGGVGGLAAAVLMRFWVRAGAHRPRFVVVEPELAACLYASARARVPTAVTIERETMMAGLSCGEPSLLAWAILGEAADGFMTIPEHAAPAAMRLLADAPYGDAPIVAGESAVAGLAGLIAAAAVPSMAAGLDLTRSSRALVFGTEGATDPAVYEALVGRRPEDVLQVRSAPQHGAGGSQSPG